jgi:hypothetical protein
VRVDVVAFLGLKEFARFHVDLVTSLAIGSLRRCDRDICSSFNS